jgi:ElaB/YqjD/DUF883 family membrane-anchored ribosome-binding protein
MEATGNDMNGDYPEEGRRLRRAARETARQTRIVGRDELSRLVADVEELVRRIATAADPELARLRANVEQALATTKEALADGTDRVRREARDALVTGDRVVHERPWEAIGVATIAALAIGFLLGRR